MAKYRLLPIQDRMRLQTQAGDENECWIWIGSAQKRGYGFIKKNGKTTMAHRVAYELAYGELPDGLFVCHKCDNPRCVNPKHLFVGTHNDNMLDMHNKGRSHKPAGEIHPNSKLTETEAIEILNSIEPYPALAAKHNISLTSIYDIKTGRKWKHLHQANKRAEMKGYGA
jgi:hypothetical protein